MKSHPHIQFHVGPVGDLEDHKARQQIKRHAGNLGNMLVTCALVSRIPHLKCYKSEIMFTNGLRHSRHHHEVVHAHGGHVIHLVLLEKLLQVSPQQIHKVDKLNVFMIIASLWDYSGDLWEDYGDAEP